MEKLDQIAVRVFEGGHPAAPGFLLRGTYKLNSFFRQAAMFGMNVVRAEVDHYAVGIFCGAFHSAVESEA